MIEQQGWIIVDVVEQAVTRAKARRAERDRSYGNIYEERDTDCRWVGELGELYFDRWLRYEGVSAHAWVLDAPAGKPDFKLGGESIDVKTVKRQVAVRRHYTAPVTARHVHEPRAPYFFA